jgi:TRAP-type uncharacterized transport system substrate-binding protein
MKRLLFACVAVLLAACAFSLAATSDALAAAKAKTEKVVFAAGRPDDAWYALSYGLAKMINERSEWLEAEVVATAGVADNHRLVKPDPAKRANHVIICQTPGMELWNSPEYQARKIGSCLHLTSAWVTLNPNIKTFKDLKGKSVAMSRKGPGFYVWMFADLLKQAEVWDTIKPKFGGTSTALAALQDGAAEAGYIMFNYIYPDTYQIGPFLEELKTRGPLYFLQQGDVENNIEMIRKSGHSEEYKAAPLPTLALVVPPKALGENQTESMAIISSPIFWAAGLDMPEKTVYEITRIMYEAAEKGEFADFNIFGKGITPEFLTTSFWETEADCRKNYHPGALMYYDERGARLKSFGESYIKK